jgi:hypothetical protein
VVTLDSVVLQKVLREALTSAVPPAEATAAAVAKIFPGAVTPSQVSMHTCLGATQSASVVRPTVWCYIAKSKSPTADLVLLSVGRMAAEASHYDSLQWRSGRFWISQHGHCWRSLCRAPLPPAMQP